MQFYLFAFGKLKTPGLRETADYYQKIIRPWVNLKEIELKPLNIPEKSASTRLRIQEQEGRILLDRIDSEIKGRSFTLLLDEIGKPKTTQEWAKQIESWEPLGISTVSFCLGSSLGFSKQVREKTKGSMSLGPQTLSHELARVVLLEQLYRSVSILKGHPYHNSGS